MSITPPTSGGAFEEVERNNPNIDWEPILVDNPEGYGTQLWCTSPSDVRGFYPTCLRENFELHFDNAAWRERNQIGTLKKPDRIARRKGEHPGD